MQLFDAIQGLVSGKINEIKGVISLIKLEARLAGYSVLPLCLNVCFLFVSLLSLWFTTLGLLGYFLMLVTNNMLMTIGLIWLLNMLVFVCLFKYLKFNLHSMSFSKTRSYFSKEKEVIHDNLAEQINNSHQDDGKEITSTTI